MIDCIIIIKKDIHVPEGNIPYEKKKKTYPWRKIVANSPSVSQSLTLDRIDKVKTLYKISIASLL